MRSINDYIPTLISVIITLYILIRLYQTAIKAGQSIQLAMFAFAAAGYLLSGLYWVSFDILYPMERLPFAANEIAEWAMFLSMASTLTTILTVPARSAKWDILFAVVFMAANVALWIAWSGEWMQDIITGIVFGYFLINLVRMLKMTDALSRSVRIVLVLVCIILIMANIATFFVPELLADLHDLITYCLLCITQMYFMIKSIISLYKNEDPVISLAFSFSAVAWSIIYMYMSSGVFYNIANICLSVSFLLVFVSLKREVSHDLC